MNVKFKQDYQGRETNMVQYRKGDKADFPNAQALALIRLGVASEVWTEIGKQFDPPTVEKVIHDEIKPKNKKVVKE